MGRGQGLPGLGGREAAAEPPGRAANAGPQQRLQEERERRGHGAHRPRVPPEPQFRLQRGAAERPGAAARSGGVQGRPGHRAGSRHPERLGARVCQQKPQGRLRGLQLRRGPEAEGHGARGAAAAGLLRGSDGRRPLGQAARRPGVDAEGSAGGAPPPDVRLPAHDHGPRGGHDRVPRGRPLPRLRQQVAEGRDQDRACGGGAERARAAVRGRLAAEQHHHRQLRHQAERPGSGVCERGAQGRQARGPARPAVRRTGPGVCHAALADGQGRGHPGAQAERPGLALRAPQPSQGPGILLQALAKALGAGLRD
mmetsp:Transcript_30832/g.95912  ORF Transcript_30832/g.95912 Transcript_30832/m.95912 type:complete len:311 (+) Transcript_30832:277-1209(+)